MAICGLAAMLYSPELGWSFQSQGPDLSKLKDPEFIAAGSKLFAPTCGSGYCHGTGGMGGGAPRIRDIGLDPAFAFKRISDGAPGTAMMGFKEQFNNEELWKLVAFLLSSSKNQTLAPDPVIRPINETSSKSPKAEGSGMASEVTGDPVAGKALFFDSSSQVSCHLCHTFEGSGTPIGPDLSNSPAGAQAILHSIVLPRVVENNRFVILTMKDGEIIRAVKKDEDAEAMKVYDVTALPAVLRTIQRENISKVEPMKASPMPSDYSSRYTMKQLLDLITFLKSSGPGTTRVTLRDLF